MDDEDLMLAANWSELLVELLDLIMNKLKKNTFSFLDYIRFGAVCFQWRSVSIQNHKQIKLPSNLPLLLIPSPFDHDHDELHDDQEEEEEEEEENEDDDNHDDVEHQLQMLGVHNHIIEPQPPREYYYKRNVIWKGQDETRHKSTRSFYSLSEGKINQDFQLHVPYYKNCRGSSHGWLITVDEKEQPDGTSYRYPVRLLNPFRSVNNQIQLPPLPPNPALDEKPDESYYLLKAYLSANPSTISNLDDLIVFGVYVSNRFGFCRPGDKAWTHFPVENQFRPIEDLICYKGRFLAIIQDGSVLELDFFAPEPSVKFVTLTPPNWIVCNKKYLVESGGDLLQVQRDYDIDHHSTTGFRAFKLNDDADNDDDKWVEMDNLDGRMLFLGDNSSISLSAADFPGLMPNCIYFTDDNYEAYHSDHWVGPHDIGIFNFEDRSVVFDHGPIMPPPIWIQPML